MKLVIRAFAFLVVLAGGAAAAIAPTPIHNLPSAQAGPGPETPVPVCGPNMPTCPPRP